ncbi:MAG: glycoside hydrolase family 19 protein, partial [Bordetella sp.]|nr:glycoside hydrolase family 19 protein [Bordetella sp.]
MLFTAEELARIMRCPPARAARWHPHLLKAAGRFGISTKRRAAHWLAQVGHESLSLSRVEENLSYSRERLLEVFGNEVSPAQAGAFIHNPVALGNHVYARQNGNGDAVSG